MNRPNIQKINDKIKILEDMFIHTLFFDESPDEYEFKKVFVDDIMDVYREAGNHNYKKLYHLQKDRLDQFGDLYRKLYTNNIFGLISRDEARALWTMTLQLGPGKRIVEIGTFLGFSTCFLAQNNFAYAVDNKFDHFVNDYEIGFFIGFYHDGDKVWERVPRNILKGEICDNNWRIAGVFPNVLRINKFSTAAVEDIEGKIDLAFIDGDHGYEPCKKDIGLYFPKLNKSGIIAFHDFNNGTHGVALAVHEFYNEFKDILSPPYISDSVIWFIRQE